MDHYRGRVEIVIIKDCFLVTFNSLKIVYVCKLYGEELCINDTWVSVEIQVLQNDNYFICIAKIVMFERALDWLCILFILY